MDKEQVYQELKTDHWMQVYNWGAVEAKIDAVARYMCCSVEELREMMHEIAEKYPKPRSPKRKPKTWRDIAYERKCRTCGQRIGFARTENGKLMPVNLLDHTTHWGCEKPGKRKKGKKCIASTK